MIESASNNTLAALNIPESIADAYNTGLIELPVCLRI